MAAPPVVLGGMIALRWLIHRRRIGPLIRNLRRASDPLFR